MKQKKILAVVLSAVMMCSMTACGGVQDNSEAQSLEEATVEAETELIGTPTEAEPEEDTEEKAKAEVPGFDTSYNIEETVLVDENDVIITATELAYTNSAVELKLLIENNSDKNLSFVTGSVGYSPNAVNGYMLSGYLYAEVATGKKTNESIRYSLDELAIYGITKIADIQVGFDIKDENYEGYQTGPIQVKTAAADSYDYTADTYAESVNGRVLESIFEYEVDYFAEDVLYEQNGVSVVSQALLTNKDGEQAVFLEVVNNSEEEACVTVSDISLNGLVVCGKGWINEMVYLGMRKVIQMPVASMIEEEYREMFGIAEAGELAMYIELKDSKLNTVAEPVEITIDFAEGVPMFEVTGTEVYNSEGIRVISKGIVDDPEELIDYVDMILLVENTTDEPMRFTTVYDSLSINGFMTDCYYSGRDIPPGKVAFIELPIAEEDLETNGIMSIDDITEAEFGMEIKDEHYDVVAESTVRISY